MYMSLLIDYYVARVVDISASVSEVPFARFKSLNHQWFIYP